MKTPDDIRAEFDPGSPHLRVVKPTPPPRPTEVWADDIQLELESAGAIDGFAPREGIGVIYGDSGTGKTFAAIDLGCCVASGQPWRDMPTEQGVVVYIAAENPESVKRRIWAWKRHHKVGALPVLVIQVTVDLLNGSTAYLVDRMQKLRAEHGRIAMVVFDTLARSMSAMKTTRTTCPNMSARSLLSAKLPARRSR